MAAFKPATHAGPWESWGLTEIAQFGQLMRQAIRGGPARKAQREEET
jgi:hypothetical protein